MQPFGFVSFIFAVAVAEWEAYTSPQSGANRLTMAQWEQLQGVLLWAEPTPEPLGMKLLIQDLRWASDVK